LVASISQVGTDQLRRAGFTVREQVSDIGTQLRRIQNQNPPSQGGWNVFFSVLDGVLNFTPVTNLYLRGNGKSGPPGWPVSPELETLRTAFLDEANIEGQRRVAREIQMQLRRDVPYIPLGHWVRQTAHRDNLVDLPRGFPTFYGVRKAWRREGRQGMPMLENLLMVEVATPGMLDDYLRRVRYEPPD
jgi:peptide/nickel transport system substrate-binding protein